MYAQSCHFSKTLLFVEAGGFAPLTTENKEESSAKSLTSDISPCPTSLI